MRSHPGQAITGTYSAAAPGDSISVRYWTDTAAVPSDANILNCSGAGNTTGGQLLWSTRSRSVGALASWFAR